MIILPFNKYKGKNIYIGVYCFQICKYKLFAQFKYELVINLNQYFYVNLIKDNVNFFNYTNQESYAEYIEIISLTNSYSTKYRMNVYKGINLF